MATNKKKILVTESMSQQGRILLNEREDIELVEFPNMISAGDFEAMLKQQAPVHGVALGATRFGEPELSDSGYSIVLLDSLRLAHRGSHLSKANTRS